MTWLSLGSMTLPYQLRNQGHQMRADIARLGEELTTGLVRDPSSHLGGATGSLAAITGGLSRTDAYLQNAKTATIRADIAQGALSVVDQARTAISQDLLLAMSSWIPGNNLEPLGNAAKAALSDSVSAFSTRNAGVSLFSGTATDRVPLVSADEMLADLATAITGLTSATDIANEIEAQFQNPGGLFETDFYLGGISATGPTIADGETLSALPTADTQGVRQLLAGLATAALLADPPAGLPLEGQRDLADRAANLLVNASSGLAELQAQIGTLQASLETHQTRLLAERDTLSAGKLALIGADPYETATRLQDTEARLEALYTITARTARLSLTEYLR